MRRFAVLAIALLLLATTATPAVAHRPRMVGGLLVPAAAQLGGAWGMAFDADDHLWIGNISGRSITKIDPGSGAILARYGWASGAEGADDVAFNPVDGAIYYTAILTGEVGRIAPDGTHSTVANLGMGVNPITFSDDGRLFVGKAFMSDGLWELDPETGDVLAEIMPETGNPATALNGFDWYNGHLYAPWPDGGKVLKIKPVPGGKVKTMASGLVYPHAVDLTPCGKIFVAAGDGIYRVRRDAGTVKLVTPLVADNLAIDSHGRLFASGGNDGGVYRVRRDGEVITISEPGLSVSYGVAATTGPDGREIVYVADKFDFYAFRGYSGRQILRDGSLPMPDTVAIDGENVIITSGFTNGVVVWNPAGGYPVSAYWDFKLPMNAIRFDGDLVVAELLPHQAGDTGGQVVRMDESTPATRAVMAELAVPMGLAATNDDLYVTDLVLGGVYQLVKDGVAGFWPVVTGLNGPEGLAVLPDGDLLVVESWAHKLLLVDVHQTPAKVTTLLTDLDVGMPAAPGMAPGWTFEGVAVGPSGTIYLSAEGLYRYRLRR
jgi:sugar lactone lactonase YvrE